MLEQKKSIVILYTELAAYTIACLEALAVRGVIVHVIHYPVNKEAPFKFNLQHKSLFYFNKKAYNRNQLTELIERINPSLMYCAGWIDKDYLHVVKKHKHKSVTILGFDNKWVGNIKQRLSSIYARLFITPYFNYAFVPGNLQQTFALHLGFKQQQIIKGVYSADVNLFNSIYNKQLLQKNKELPKRFIYIGRYYDFKGITELWQAFIEFKNETSNTWELWCLGTGDIIPIEHPDIKHYGFVQPADLEHYLYQTSVFILPSKFEPWGVVVHEMSAAGFPLLLSNEIGAKEQFLEENSNGFSFNTNDPKSIKNALQRIALKTDEELITMGAHSHKLAQSITPEIWADKLMKLLD